MKLDQVLVGSCSNGRIEDIALIAELVKGKRVAKGVRFIVTPASQKNLPRGA
jgi:3-isopropylmalate/(R)-2-methylmalate dehydratase large subunit